MICTTITIIYDFSYFPEAECLPLLRNSLKLVVCLIFHIMRIMLLLSILCTLYHYYTVVLEIEVLATPPSWL